MRRHGSKNAFLLDNNAVITQSSFTLDLLKGHICCFVNTCASLKTQGRKMTCVSEHRDKKSGASWDTEGSETGSEKQDVNKY